MYNIITKLQAKFNQRPKFYLIIFSLFLFLLTTLIITIAIYSNLHDERITITNLDSLAKNLSSDKKAELEKLLYFTTKANILKSILVIFSLILNQFSNPTTSIIDGQKINRLLKKKLPRIHHMLIALQRLKLFMAISNAPIHIWILMILTQNIASSPCCYHMTLSRTTSRFTSQNQNNIMIAVAHLSASLSMPAIIIHY